MPLLNTLPLRVRTMITVQLTKIDGGLQLMALESASGNSNVMSFVLDPRTSPDESRLHHALASFKTLQLLNKQSHAESIEDFLAANRFIITIQRAVKASQAPPASLQLPWTMLLSSPHIHIKVARYSDCYTATGGGSILHLLVKSSASTTSQRHRNFTTSTASCIHPSVVTVARKVSSLFGQPFTQQKFLLIIDAMKDNADRALSSPANPAYG